ncbi:MAG: ADP-ribosylglycohydrolase family protein [bacterium]
MADRARRRHLGEALARVTHTDPRAVEAAAFAEPAALAAWSPTDADRRALVAQARRGVQDAELAGAIDAALIHGPSGVTGFILHSLPVVAWAFVTHGDAPIAAIRATIRLGGDTDTHAAMVGALCGALHGEAALPTDLVAALAPGPFGARHLRRLADALADGGPAPRYSRIGAWLRNLALYPVILAHGFRRLLP